MAKTTREEEVRVVKRVLLDPLGPPFLLLFLTVASIFRVKRLDVLRSDDNNLTGQKSNPGCNHDLSRR